MPSRRDIFQHLPHKDLRALIQRHDLKVVDRRVKEQLATALDKAPEVKLDAALGNLSWKTLRGVCRALGLDEGGKKAVLITRLLKGSQVLKNAAKLAGTAVASNRREYHNLAGLREHLSTLLPIPKAIFLTHDRCIRAQHALLADAGHTLQESLGWFPAIIEVGLWNPPKVRKNGKPVAKTRGSYDHKHVSVVLDDKFVVTFRSVRPQPPHPCTNLFVEVVFAALMCGLSTIRSVESTRTGSESSDQAFEVIAHGLATWIATTFLRRLLEEPLSDLQRFFLGHMPFKEAYESSVELLDWLRGLPASTFEGSLVETGVVLETAKAPPVTTAKTAEFSASISFSEARASGQRLVLADGRRTFLLLREKSQVHGIVMLPRDLEDLYLEGADQVTAVTLPLNRLWVRAVDHRRLTLYGEIEGGDLVHVANIRSGRVRLMDPRNAVGMLADVIRRVVVPQKHSLAILIARTLVRRAQSGHGGGLVIGAEPATDKLERLRVPVGTDDDRWTSLLNPDGAVLMTPELEVTAYGAHLKRSEVPTSSGGQVMGTRHSAMMSASYKRQNVAIALSDDGILSAFVGGERILKIE